MLVDTKVFMRIWIETRTKLNGKLHNKIFSACGRRGSRCLPLAVHSCLGMAHWAGLAEMLVLAATWWVELEKEEGGRRPKNKNGWEGGGVSYPGSFKQFHC